LVQCRSSVVGTSLSNVDVRHGSFGDKRTFFRAQPFKLPSSLPPEVLQRRRAQLRVSGRALDRSMAEPILNASRTPVTEILRDAAASDCMRCDRRDSRRARRAIEYAVETDRETPRCG
jgi:hypothetical protein